VGAGPRERRDLAGQLRGAAWSLHRTREVAPGNAADHVEGERHLREGRGVSE
jgi:hypothetical protein